MRASISVLGVVLALGASGCFFTSPSEGELGIVELAYDEGLFGCLFGCDAREPMAANANTFINVVNHEELAMDYAPFVVESSNTAVFETIQSEPGDASIRITSHVPGAARMVFTEAGTGELIDRYQLNVEEIRNIELGSPEITSRLLVFIGGSVSIYMHLFDGADRQLKGFGGVEYTVTGGLTEAEVTVTSALAEAIVRAFAGSTSESATIVANAVGAGRIDVAATRGDAMLSIDAEVVDASRVARVEVESQTVEPNGTASLSAHAFDASGEEIFDPECAWTFMGTGVTSTSMSRHSISLTATSETSGQATCTIGSTSASGTATFMVDPGA